MAWVTPGGGKGKKTNDYLNLTPIGEENMSPASSPFPNNGTPIRRGGTPLATINGMNGKRQGGSVAKAPRLVFMSTPRLSTMNLSELKEESARLGIMSPGGHKGRKATWERAIRDFKDKHEDVRAAEELAAVGGAAAGGRVGDGDALCSNSSSSSSSSSAAAGSKSSSSETNNDDRLAELYADLRETHEQLASVQNECAEKLKQAEPYKRQWQASRKDRDTHREVEEMQHEEVVGLQQVVWDLREQLRETNETHAALERNLQEARAECEAKGFEVAAAESEISQMKDDTRPTEAFETLERTLESARSEASAQTSRVAELEEVLSRMTASQAGATELLASKEALIGGLEGTVSSLRETLQQSTAGSQDLEASRDAAHDEIKALVEASEVSKEREQTLVGEKETLALEKEAAQKELAQASEVSKQALVEAAEQASKAAKATKAAEEQEQAVAVLVAEKAALGSEITSLREELARAAEASKSLEAKLASETLAVRGELASAAASSNAQKQVFEAEQVALVAKAAALQEEVDALAEKLTHAAGDVGDAGERERLLEGEKRALEAQCASIQEEFERFTESSSELEKALEGEKESLEVKCASLQEEFDGMTESSAELEQALESEKVLLEGELRDSEASVATLAAKALKLEQELGASRAGKVEADQQLNAAQEQLGALGEAQATEKGAKKALEKQNDEYEGQVHILEATVADLQGKLDDEMERAVLLGQELEDAKEDGQEREHRLQEEVKEERDNVAHHQSLAATSEAELQEQLADLRGKLEAAEEARGAVAAQLDAEEAQAKATVAGHEQEWEALTSKHEVVVEDGKARVASLERQLVDSESAHAMAITSLDEKHREAMEVQEERATRMHDSLAGGHGEALAGVRAQLAQALDAQKAGEACAASCKQDAARVQEQVEQQQQLDAEMHAQQTRLNDSALEDLRSQLRASAEKTTKELPEVNSRHTQVVESMRARQQEQQQLDAEVHARQSKSNDEAMSLLRSQIGEAGAGL